MNKGIYQLVFSRVHHAMVAVAEIASSRAGDGKSRARRAASIWLALSFSPLPWAVMNAFAELPSGIEIRDAINAQGVINNATQITSSSANHISFQQLVPQAIVNYNKLNLDRGQSFNVDMQAGWSMLNRVHSVDPSVLNGNVNAAGNIYFLNANGVIIGKDAVFNVGSLYAGTLNITDELFKSGFVNEAGYTSAFQLVDTINLTPEQANKINTAEVRVQSGAQINAAKGGKVLLFAPNVNVEKNAIIKTPDGQTILAAGKTIYLKSSQDPAGMLVEVSSGGTATNLGEIIAARGNITMMGLAVNQGGKLSASTSVRANGSIHLIAQEDVTVLNGQVTQQRNGMITLGKDSVTEVTPELNDKEEVLASLPFKTSSINLEASLINIDGAISAKGGNVTATTNVNASALLNSPIAQRIHLGENASIDVSGVDALAPMSRNQLTVQLNSDALKDNPILRGSALFGKTIFVDARKGTELFDLKPYIDSTRLATVAEKMTNAGKVTLSNANEIIVEKGAKIDVSGGSTTYSAGTVKESILEFNGQLVAISEAKPGVAYERVADTTTVVDRKWGSSTTYSQGNINNAVPTYFEGANAGTVSFVSPIENGFVQKLVVDGDLIGNTKVSTQQLLANTAPKGASLIASALNLNWVNNANNLASNFAFGDVLNGGDSFISSIGTQFLRQGFNRIDFSNVKNLNVNTAIQLDANGALTLGRAGDTLTQINQNITAQGANVAMNANLTRIADNVTVTTAGTFVNDRAGVQGALTKETAANAGNITIGRLVTGGGVKIDASAGAYVDNAGVLHLGKAGNISLQTTDQGLSPTLNLSAYGFDRGGSLNIRFSEGEKTHLYIGADNAPNGPLDFSIDNVFFSKGGFSSYRLSAFDIDIGAAGQTNPSTIYGVAQNLMMRSGFQSTASRDSIFDVARLTTLPDATRAPVSFTFDTYRVADDLGTLTLHENAHIKTDIGGSVALSAGKQVNVLGDITAHGGQIALSIADDDTTLPEDASQMVFIGEKAQLNVAGTTITMPDSRAGKLNNKVVNAGSITINTDDNIKGAVVIKQGAVLDVSGSQTQTHTRTNRGFVLETLYGDAGSIDIYGVGSLLVDGTLRGQANGTGRGGSLGLFYQSVPFDFIDPYPNQSGRFLVTNNQQVLTGGLQAGDALKDINLPASSSQGRLQNAQISAQQIEEGGFDHVTLASYINDPTNPNNRINFASDLDLTIAGNLRLNSPVLSVLDNGHAKINSGHLQLFSRTTTIDPSVFSSSSGQLSLSANQIYIDGLVAVTGTNKTILSANKDIHGQGEKTAVLSSTVADPAGLSVAGELQLHARQIYPNSGAKLSFEAQGPNSLITVQSNGVAPTNVLSGGGTLSLTADRIVQAGVLKAPFGQIKLNAADQVTLAAGSLTSVSGSGQNIPYGETISSGQTFNPNAGVSQKPIEKEIAISAPNADLQQGAVMDLSGGGELFAYEWISGGVGGTQDILAQSNTYALIPSLQTEFAANDRLYEGSSAGVGTGQTIYITGVKGIPSGTYTLMPARYALVPGAFIVQKTDVALARGQTASLQDGSALTSGYFADLNTGARDANWSSFRVIDGSVLRPAAGTVSKAPSQYVVTNASSFFANPLKTNGVDIKNTDDAGKLTLLAQQLNLDASVQARKVTGADGLVVDISANAIRVVNQRDNTDPSSLQLEASKLNALNADSILLGGTRNVANNVTNVTTQASSVSIENDASHALSTLEFLATANNNVSLLTGAVINTGNSASQPKAVNLNTTGDGAFLGMSSVSQLEYTRTGSSVNATSGVLDIAANTQLSAGNSLVIDGSQNVSFAGNIALGANANVTLGSNRILIGDVPASQNGLLVSNQTLAQLGDVSRLTLNSYSTIDTYGSVDFGNNRLNLTVNAAGIVGHLADGETAAPANAAVTINAKSFALKNTVDANYNSPSDPSGRRLQINAETVRLQGDPSAVLDSAGMVASADRNTIGGFDSVYVDANTLTVAERGALDLQVNQTTLNVGRINTESSANYAVASTGALTSTQKTVSNLPTNSNIGGRLTLQADQLLVNSRIEALAGQVNLQGTSQLELGSQAIVSASSTTKNFANKASDVDAGKVQLNSGGNIIIDQGALVNVGAQGSANAGQVTLSATSGNLQLQGQLNGQAQGSGKGGTLAVDVGTMPSMVAIDQQATGFSQSRSYRVRSGDVNIDGTGAQALTAKQVLVSADQGAITVTGTIDANSTKSGSIALYARDDVTLESGSLLRANSSTAGAEGGKVTLATASGALNLNQGSRIEVAGGTGGNGGEVHLRAPRTGSGSGNGVAVNSLDSSISGAQSIVLEAFRIYNNASTITTGTGTGATLGFTTLANDVNNFMANKDNILASLGMSNDSRFHLRAGQEIRSNNNLTVAADWNLYTTSRAGDEPGILTLRATNNLNLNGSISDGFETAASSAALGTGDSWSYRLISGADTDAANVMETVAATLDADGKSLSGNLTLANNKLIRTGTGSIDIATGGDLNLATATSVIYTAGEKAADLTGFTDPITSQRPTYLDNGGDIRIDSKGNIFGAEDDSRQAINQWLFRQGGNNQLKDTSWWIRTDQFRQSLAALGGGNVTVNADRNIANFSVSIPTTARFDNFGTGATGNNVVNGGGDLTVTAQGDIFSGIYFIGQGTGTIKAGGSISAEEGKNYGTVLAMMNGQFDVSAGKDLRIEATVNPTLLPQSITNAPNNDSTIHNSYFSTYGQSAAVRMTSLGGNVNYAANVNTLLDASSGLRSGVNGALSLNPASLDMTAYVGNVTVGQAYLSPSSLGNLQLLANNDVRIGKLLMSDANPTDIFNINTPTRSTQLLDDLILLSFFNLHASSPLHANSTTPARVVAATGNIRSNDDTEPGLLMLAKESHLVAGQDITRLNIGLQNNRTSDVSVLLAGRDVNTQNVVIAGPGELLVQAGRNIDLIYPLVTSIQATGNTGTSNPVYEFTSAFNANTALPSNGASITMLAGVGDNLRLQNYIDTYIAPGGSGPETIRSNSQRLAEYKAQTAEYLVSFMRQLTGDQNLTSDEAYTQFNAQSDAVKTVFVNRHLTTELINSANDFAKARNHDRGNNALATLYSTKQAGDILLFNTKVSTNSGGSIDLVTPGGLINVGVPGRGGDIGIITEKGGAIRGISDGDFSVNQSKVITQFGSDIAIWSTNGTIDAGRGSKTATSVPERIVQTDVFGNTVVEVRGVAAGSGIRAQTYDPDGPNEGRPEDVPRAGKVTLTAPVVDAGEAGIEAGDLTIVAPVVLNAGNIQVQGVSSGVPVAATATMAGVTAGVSPDAVNAAAQAVAQNVANAAVNNDMAKPKLPSIISVDVIGIGQ